MQSSSEKSCRFGAAKMLLVAAAFVLAAQARAEEFDFFESRIRPVLVEHCYKCHSSQSEEVKGGLLLDSKSNLLKGGEQGLVITPGDAEKSRLIEAIRYRNPDLQMPPKRKLTDQQIEDFIVWVNMGAPDPRSENVTNALSRITPLASRVTSHWSFQPVRHPPIPAVQDTSWPNTPVDFFILEKLEANRLSPAPLADKRTLLRRVTFDLTGLPPTSQEMDDFMADASLEAYAKVVDRLLASPRYGERWGRHWLDVARYADTKGYVYGDREEPRFVHSYVYRDWVIRAFNEDLPYNQFLLQQIAADQLTSSAKTAASEEPDALAAMGFLTLGRRFLGVAHDIIDDRIDVVMRGTQALTVGCARCHDHKFDPIPIADYYSLYGIFAGCTEKMVSLRTPPEASEAHLQYEKGFRERVDKFNQTMERKRQEFSNRFRSKAADYLVAVLDVKKLPTEEHYEIRGPDDLNPAIVRNWENYLLQTKREFHPVFAVWHALESLPKELFASKAAEVIERLARSDALSNRVNAAVVQALNENRPPATMRGAAERYGKLFASVHQRWQAMVQAATTNKTALPAALPDPHLEEVRQVLYGPNAPVNIPRLAAADMEWYFDEPSRVEMMKLHAEIERWIIKSPGAPPHSVILEDRPTQKNPRVFLRGNPANKGDEVPRQFLGIVAGANRKPFEIGSGRLELARAIADPNNPLTARVMVNRIWLHHFGEGLVRTPSDFGTRSDPPSHPELLDWLARCFMTNGWSIKNMHRLLLFSKVYQQRSDVAPEPSVDPQNRFLWKMNRQRLDFETLRDSLLATSGELNLKGAGPPEELFKQPISQRRTVYGLIDRQFLPGLFRVFDFANPDMHSPQRSDTTVPQQALFFMNSPFAVERARALLNRSEIASETNPEERLQRLYRTAYQRTATPQQLAFGLNFLRTAGTEPRYEPPPPPVSAWEYGYGEYNDSAKRVENFHRLPHFTGDAWQGSEKWPDEKLGWVRLTAAGGHAGNDLKHSAVRRWRAPFTGRVTITGPIKHDHAAGDGIRARLVSSRHGQLGDWTLHKSAAEPKLEPIEVMKGDKIDFVVDFRANLNSDDFAWAPIIKVAGPHTGADYATEWSAKKEFSGPPPQPPKPLNAWEQFAQVLLLSNEFMFVD